MNKSIKVLFGICITLVVAAIVVLLSSFSTAPETPGLKYESTPAWVELTEEQMLLNLAAVQREEEVLNAETQQMCTDHVSAWVEEIDTPNMSLDWGAADAYLLAKIAYAEARGEDVEGQALVILVVLNRVRSDSFPDTIEEVILQTNPTQFAGVQSEAWQVEELPPEAWEALRLVESGWDESQGATYFESIALSSETSWHKEHLVELFTHGGHAFYIEP